MWNLGRKCGKEQSLVLGKHSQVRFIQLLCVEEVCGRGVWKRCVEEVCGMVFLNKKILYE